MHATTSLVVIPQSVSIAINDHFCFVAIYVCNYMYLPFILVGFCDYPTYYDTDTDECVLTCPPGTIGDVSGNDNVTMRNCTSRELVLNLCAS